MTTKRATFAPLEGAEYQCAIEAIVGSQLEPSQFVLEERRTEMRYPGGDRRVHKLVSVKCLTAGIQRQYSSAPGGGWPFEFERDLRLGMYGPQPIASLTGAAPRRP
ncbi:MAG: hypothetical protein ACXWG3_01240 [Usitatibacter sp.]